MLGAVFANDARLIACALPTFEIGAERARMTQDAPADVELLAFVIGECCRAIARGGGSTSVACHFSSCRRRGHCVRKKGGEFARGRLSRPHFSATTPGRHCRRMVEGTPSAPTGRSAVSWGRNGRPRAPRCRAVPANTQPMPRPTRSPRRARERPPAEPWRRTSRAQRSRRPSRRVPGAPGGHGRGLRRGRKAAGGPYFERGDPPGSVVASAVRNG